MLSALLGQKAWAAPSPPRQPILVLNDFSPASIGKSVPTPSKLSVQTRQLLPKLKHAALKAAPQRSEALDALADNVRSGLVSEELYPLLGKLAQDGLPLPHAGVEFPGCSEKVDLLWATPRGPLVVLASHTVLPAKAFAGRLAAMIIVNTKNPNWVEDIVAQLAINYAS
jgi:hypothetical protein